MPSPPGAYNTMNNTVWDEETQSYVPATSTPDLSGMTIPVSYKVALEQAAPGVTTAIDQAQKPGEGWADTLVRIIPNLTLGAQQIYFMFLNAERARKGQAPLDANAYSGAYVNVGLDPNTQRLVTYAGIGILALVVLNMVTRK
jgi:hypothetical protein